MQVLGYPDDPQAFGARIRELTGGGGGVAAVYDGVGKTTFDASLAGLALRGTRALFGASSGPVPPVGPSGSTPRGRYI
ncbi:MAG: Alcohol dehydrogenase, zinc-binding domain protein [Mycobacterium sp.]|nr:Alcohol dehydrogenase, zinc-binding domain protein [Mycobacterium sp.]